MKLEGDKIQLISISQEHTKLIIKWRNKESIRKNFIFQEEFTESIHNEWLKNHVDTGKVVQFIIYNKSNNLPVGSVYLRDIDKINNKAEYGIFIGEAAVRGKGLGTEAAKMICDYGFNDLHLHKIMLRVFADNESAIRSYEKAGFVREAYLKEDVKINNEYRNIILMAKFNQ